MRLQSKSDFDQIEGAPGWATLVSGPWLARWRGFAWARGRTTQADAVAAALGRGMDVAVEGVAGLMGAYTLVALHTPSGAFLVSSGPSAQTPLFATEEAVSDSDFELGPATGSGAALDPFAVAEILAYCNTWRAPSPVRGVRRLEQGRIAILEGGRVRVVNAPAKLRDPPKTSHEVYAFIKRYFEDLANALRGEAFECDLTGGQDSRIVCAALKHHGVAFESALSGPPDLAEFAESARVAKALDIRFHADIAPETLDEQRLCWAIDNAATAVDVVPIERLIGYVDARQGRGAQFALNGIAGESIKDVFVMHEFPQDPLGPQALGNLMARRILRAKGPTHLALPGAPAQFEALRDETTREIVSVYGAMRKQAANDAVIADKTTRGLAAYNGVWTRVGWIEYAPFLETEFHLGRAALAPIERAQRRASAKLITHYSPAAARIPTNMGYITLATPAGLALNWVYGIGRNFERATRRGLIAISAGRVQTLKMPDELRRAGLLAMPMVKDMTADLIRIGLYSEAARQSRQHAAAAPFLWRYAFGRIGASSSLTATAPSVRCPMSGKHLHHSAP